MRHEGLLSTIISATDDYSTQLCIKGVQKDFDIGIGGIVKIQNAIAGPLQQLLINDQLIMHLY